MICDLRYLGTIICSMNKKVLGYAMTRDQGELKKKCLFRVFLTEVYADIWLLSVERALT